MKSLPALLVVSSALFLRTSICFAEPLLIFGSDAAQPQVELMPGAQGEISIEADEMVVQGPNFWSMRFQMNEANLDLSQAKPDDYLVIEVDAVTADKGPYLELILVNAGWSGKAFYRFDLSEARTGEFVKATSTTKISEPVQVEGDFSPLNAPAKALQFLTKAESGNSSWTIHLKSLGVSPKE